MATEYFIPQMTTNQIALIGARTAGIIAVNIATEARKNASSNNLYEDHISEFAHANVKDKTGVFSPLDTEVFADVTFDSVTYTDNQNKVITTAKLNFQAILVSVSLPKRIVKTEIQGRDGTVKEYIGQGDAQVSFKGVISGSNGHYPANEVLSLKQMIDAPVAIPVFSTFLSTFAIHSIVFENSSFEQDEGGYSYQTFYLSGISDTPQELKMSGK